MQGTFDGQVGAGACLSLWVGCHDADLSSIRQLKLIQRENESKLGWAKLFDGVTRPHLTAILKPIQNRAAELASWKVVKRRPC